MDLFAALGGILRPAPTTDQILAELHNPNNFVAIEWTHPERVPADVRERIREEAELYRIGATAEQVEEFDLEADNALQAASYFLDLAADHGVYQTISVTLNRKA
jgi:hypothetical protein